MTKNSQQIAQKEIEKAVTVLSLSPEGLKSSSPWRVVKVACVPSASCIGVAWKELLTTASVAVDSIC